MFGIKKKKPDFKDQMKDIERDLLYKESKGTGAFVDPSYKEAFYGNQFYHGRKSNRNNTVIIVSIILAVVFVWLIFIGTVILAFSKNTSKDYYAEAKKYYDKKDYKKAVESLDKALDKNKNDFDALYLKGTSLNDMEQFMDALNCLKAAEKLKNNSKDLFLEMGYSYYNLDKYEESAACYDKVLELDKSNTEAFIWKACNYIQLKNYSEAVKLCDEALEIDNKDAFAYDTKGLAYSYMEKFEEALSAFDKAIEIDPKYEDAYLDKIYLLYHENSYYDCINFCLDSSKKLTSSSEILYYLGDCYSEQCLSEKAVEAYKSALNLDPKNADLTARLGWEYYYAQDYSNASKFADEAMSLEKENQSAVSLKAALKDEETPETEKIVKLFRENYLYIDKVKDFEEVSKNFTSKTSVSNKDIENYLNSVRVKDDPFTFILKDDDYEDFIKNESDSHIQSKMIDSNTVYIKINSFTPNVDYEFKKIVEGISKTENVNLIIDLRNNTGGLANPANSILDMLLPDCTTSYLINREGRVKSYYSGEGQVKFKKIILMVNEYTASSSELLALGLKQYLNNVTIIGHPTLGKGVGQMSYENKAMKYCIFVVNFYWNVKEKNISGDRIHPDIIVTGNSLDNYMNTVNSIIK